MRPDPRERVHTRWRLHRPIVPRACCPVPLRRRGPKRSRSDCPGRSYVLDCGGRAWFRYRSLGAAVWNSAASGRGARGCPGGCSLALGLWRSRHGGWQSARAPCPERKPPEVFWRGSGHSEVAFGLAARKRRARIGQEPVSSLHSSGGGARDCDRGSGSAVRAFRSGAAAALRERRWRSRGCGPSQARSGPPGEASTSRPRRAALCAGREEVVHALWAPSSFSPRGVTTHPPPAAGT